ncbi:unnamed protein product [Adineta ricciae]|uniref:Uncharacterized protein n=1 Tax=Adineta ricciae TaxID=249248 RepID=A0A814VVE3_ADIRI|nr:unnamed protein product [Adineta ricciae]CAF1195623.1 unnamed protein product [Adineta ricciae]
MYLGWTDYAVLVVLLCKKLKIHQICNVAHLIFVGISAIIGIYHGCIKSKQTTTNEFFAANGRMKVLPTSMSLLASNLSAATILGAPIEVYAFGIVYIHILFAWFIGTYVAVKVFIPMFRHIGSITIYAYLEQRFSSAVRITVTVTFVINYILYMAVILYGPSLALSQVTGLNIWLAIGSCGIICTFYTSIVSSLKYRNYLIMIRVLQGGMKAVIWTDVTQTIMMFLGIILSIIFGFIDAGGPAKVFHTIIGSDRSQFWIFTFDPSIRYTLWSLWLAGSFYGIAIFSCVQTQGQRYMCVKNTKTAQRAAWINYTLSVLIIVLCGIVGCLLYVKYKDCDPLKAKRISKPDQLYPLFVIETLGRFPGVTGLFIACILSASLSTVSSGVNSAAVVILEDIYKRTSTAQPFSDAQQAKFSKILSFVIGIITVSLAFAASFLKDNIIVIVFQIAGAFVAPILGIFLLGLFVSRVNSRSVLVAFYLCFAFQIWILLGANLTMKKHSGRNGRLPTSMEGCLPPFNQTEPSISIVPSSNPLLLLYSMSPLWYSFNGVVLTFSLGVLTSFVFRSNESEHIDRSLLVSWKALFCFHSREESGTLPSDELCTDVQSIEQAPMI